MAAAPTVWPSLDGLVALIKLTELLLNRVRSTKREAPMRFRY